MSLSIPGLRGWHDVPLRALVERRLSLPAHLDWRVHTATLAEQWFGDARDADDFVYVNASDGVGMALVLDGVIHGWRALAGGLGHIPVGAPSAGRGVCACGGATCLESW